MNSIYTYSLGLGAAYNYSNSIFKTGSSPMYSPKRKKLKGWEKENKRRK